MPNNEHLDILSQGVGAWNQWRRENEGEPPDLSAAILDGKDLNHADFQGANLSRTTFIGSDLSHADFQNANLRRACLNDASLLAANLRGADLANAVLMRLNVGGHTPWHTNFGDANLKRAELYCAQLQGANFSGANLFQADLRLTALNSAELFEADLSGSDLSGAHLDNADLRFANLINANLSTTVFCGVQLGYTSLVNVDLSTVVGLENAKHEGPSSIGIDTLYKSEGNLPDSFLRNAGVPEEIIDIARSIRCGPPIQWHSCFICYSTKDEEFARRLHSRMRQANMRVWFAPEDLAGGKKLHDQLFNAIQLQDRVLLVLSPHSTKSEWVITEIRKAREIEKTENRRKLFPIRLMDFEALRSWVCFDADSGKDLALEVREYFIPNFSNWNDQDAFEQAFKALQKDLEDRSGNLPLSNAHIQELTEQLREYRCPFCSAPISERGGDWVGSEHYGLHEFFECGYHALDGSVERPCSADPKFPRFEDYELEFRQRSIESGGGWLCTAVPKTGMARKLRLTPGLGSSKEDAEQKVRQAYDHSSIKWKPA